MKYMMIVMMVISIFSGTLMAADCSSCSAATVCGSEKTEKCPVITTENKDETADTSEKSDAADEENLATRLKNAIERNKSSEEEEKNRKKFELSYKFHDFLTKSERSVEFSYNDYLYSIKVIKPYSRFMDAENTGIFDFKAHFFNLLGIGYVKNGRSENYDSLYVDILFFRFGKNIDGEAGGIAYFGKYDREQAEPKKYFFLVPEIELQLRDTGFFKNNGILYEYNSQASVVGIRHHFDKNTSVDWKYTQSSEYTDVAENETGKLFRHAVAFSYKF